MAIVRRDGDWRLEKQDDGLYEVTYKGTAELRIATSDYSPGIIDERFGSVPVREVESFSEAETLFEEQVKGGGPSPVGSFGFSGSGTGRSSSTGLEADQAALEGLEELPPGGVALILISAGVYIIYIYGFAVGSLSFLLGSILALVGIGTFGWAFRLYRVEGLSAAWDFLATLEDEDHSTESESNAGLERTPPAPQKLKDDLYFDRADQKCEWCDERVDQPEVHHIESRSEGGPNTPSNLIVLCPGCHAMADRGAISRTKLCSKVQRITESAVAVE